MDSLRYFSKPKNLCLLVCLFLLTLSIMMDYFVFAFLGEKFTQFTIQQAIFVIIISGLTGYVIFTLFLTQTRRRVLNLGISGGIFALSVVMVLASLALPKATVDVMGLVCMCKCSFRSNCSFFKIQGAFGLAYCFLYAVELFPSHVRGFTMAVLIFFINLSTSVIPYLGVFTDRLGLHFLSCLLPFSLLSLVASSFLPETQNQLLKN